MEGTIFDIKNFAIHDGSGIRTTVFLKGCPLRCRWCHNPEGLACTPQLRWFANKCIGCRLCEASCGLGALSRAEDGGTRIDRKKCTDCGACVKACPTEALCFDGHRTDSEDVLRQVLDDRVFFTHSGGGVTLSGGEPTNQSKFALALFQGFHDHGIRTAIESCMYCPLHIWEKFIPLVDEFMVDIKCFDPEKHREYTGVDNAVILENFRYLAAHKDRVLVRVPLIPGMTATKENLRAVAHFVHGVRSDIRIELMNYNPLAISKYRLMDKEYCLDESVKPYTAQELDEFKSVLTEEGIDPV